MSINFGKIVQIFDFFGHSHLYGDVIYCTQREARNMKKYIYKVEGGCQLCLMCVYACPKGAISIIEDVSVQIDQDKCIGCGKCYHSCQPEAVLKIEVDA